MALPQQYLNISAHIWAPCPRNKASSRKHSCSTRINSRRSHAETRTMSVTEERQQSVVQVPDNDNSVGSEPSARRQRHSLREQLNMLELGSLSRRVLRAPRDPEHFPFESSKASEQARSSKQSKQQGARVQRALHSSSVEEVLQLLEDADDSKEGVAAAMKDWNGYLRPRDVVAILNALESWQMAFSVFKWMQAQDNAILNLYCYNVMLKVLRRGRQWKLAEGIAEDLLCVGIVPDNFTYSTLISCANRCNFQGDAFKWFERMHEAGCIPDEVTYSSMIEVYVRAGRVDEALEMYARLRRTGWKPDRVMYGTMIKIYGRAWNVKEAFLVLREMEAAGIRPDAVVYNTLISLLGRLGRTTHAVKLFEEMQNAGVRPTAVTLSALIEIYNRAGDVDAAFEVFRRLKADGVVCDAAVYNTLLKVCMEGALVTDAEAILKAMEDEACPPDDWTFKNMISLYAKRGMVDEATAMFNSLVAAGYAADIVAYTSLLRAHGNARDYRSFAEVFDQLTTADCHPDERLCGTMLSQLTLCEDAEEHAVIRRCLRKANPRLDRIVGQIVDEAFCSDALQRDFEGLLTEVPESAHKPLCNALLDLCWNKVCHKRAFKILAVLKNLGVYPGLQSKSSIFWSLHLRSLSAGAAQCALLSWLSVLRVALQEGQELPGKLIVETGIGRPRGTDEPRLHVLIAATLKEMKAPFEESAERRDWLVATGTDAKAWLQALNTVEP